jgi:hypothetical protein
LWTTSASRSRIVENNVTGRAEGNRNAWKHGRYNAKAIARRRSIAQPIRQARDLMR